MASAWRSSMPAACNRLTAACVSSTRLFYELQLCRRDELAWYKSGRTRKSPRWPKRRGFPFWTASVVSDSNTIPHRW